MREGPGDNWPRKSEPTACPVRVMPVAAGPGPGEGRKMGRAAEPESDTPPGFAERLLALDSLVGDDPPVVELGGLEVAFAQAIADLAPAPGADSDFRRDSRGRVFNGSR